MKKIFKNSLLTFVIGLIIAGSIGVYASIKIQSSEIGYKDGTVEDAIDDLYTKTPQKFCELKSGAALTVGSKYECDPGDGTKRNFYILSKNDNTIDLIMDRNLVNNTSTTWKIAMEYFRSGSGASIKNNWINVLNIDLPKAQDIADAVNNKSWIVVNKSSISADWFCLESKSNDETNLCKTTNTGATAWLYDNLSGCSQYHCAEESESIVETGYWTKDSVINVNPPRAWLVKNVGNLSTGPITNTDIGVRPVITVLKSNLSN